MPIPKTVKLSSGHDMPVFGLGTYLVNEVDTYKKTIVDMGYRLLDCASFYKNEEVVGEALTEIIHKDQSVKREDLFVVSKIWYDEMEDIEGACRRSLAKLKVDYLDLYLVHWPVALKEGEVNGEKQWVRVKKPMHVIWAEMEALVEKGLVKSIGVSNFNIQLLWDVLNYAKIPPAVNEIELHPLCVQPDLVKFHLDNKIFPLAYCPLARGADTASCPNILDSPAVKAASDKYSKTGAQVLLNWGLRRGHAVIPRSNNLGRLQENLNSMDFELTDDEVAEISKIDEGVRICDGTEQFGFKIFV